MKHVLKHAGTAALALTLLLSGCGQTVGQASDQETEKSTENTATQAISLVTDFPTTQYFTDEAVQEGDVTTILTAGANAPSAMNGQPWHFTAITDRDVLQQIADDMSSGFPAGMQPPAEGESGTESPSAPPEGGDGDMELESPAVEDGESTPPAAAGSGDESGAAPAKADITGAPLAIVISCAEGLRAGRGPGLPDHVGNGPAAGLRHQDPLIPHHRPEWREAGGIPSAARHSRGLLRRCGTAGRLCGPFHGWG